MKLVNPPRIEGHKPTFYLAQDEGMPYTPLTKQALRLSFEVHKTQLDKSGIPYVYHPFHLADQMRTEEAACVALLHDSVEDGDLSFDDLAKAGFPPEVVDAIAALTHDSSVPYMDYVLGLRAKPLAREVKLADLRHNSNLSRLDTVSPRDLQRQAKYLIAQALLDDSSDRFDPFLNPPVWIKRIPLDGQQLHFVSLYYTEAGEVVQLSLDVESASDEHHTVDAAYLDAMRQAFSSSPSLFEGLADTIAAGGIYAVLRTLREVDIPYKSCYFY